MQIDTILGSVEWLTLFLGCFLKGLSSALSDHCPLLLSTVVKACKHKRFRFKARKEGFLEQVEQAWNNQAGEDITSPILCFHENLKQTAKALQSWSAKKFGDIQEQIIWAKTIISLFDQAQDSSILSFRERWLRRELKKRLLGLCTFERTMARQRSRITWLREGDANHVVFSHPSKSQEEEELHWISV